MGRWRAGFAAGRASLQVRVASRLVVAAACFTLDCHQQDVTAPDGGWSYDLGAARSMRLLYAGVPEEPRGERFLAFLRANFDEVEAIDLEDLDAARAADRDVVIADWRPRWKDGALDPEWAWPEVRLGSNFTKPLVLLSNAPLSIQQGSKLSSW